MPRVCVCLLILLSASNCNAAEAEADFYVSVRGSDHWSGMLAAPNAQKSVGPFATLGRARDAVRELKKQKTTDVLVLIRKGTYQISKTLIFDLEDSGVGTSTITYAAYPGETPVFSSGRKIEGWERVTGKLPGLPESAQGKLLLAKTSDRFLTLYDADGMLPRARSARFVPKGSANELRFPKGQLKNRPNVQDVEILVRPTRLWTMNVPPLVSVDERWGVARTAIPATYGMNKIGCWVENVLEELDTPGEWALNTNDGKVYLWPRSSLHEDESPVMAPQLIEYIRLEGAIDKKGPKDKGRVGEDRRGRVPARMKDIDSDNNIYFCEADRSRSDNILKKLQADGVDANSLAVDPMFVDPENGDFRLRPNSPALKLGIVPFDTSKVGLRSGKK